MGTDSHSPDGIRRSSKNFGFFFLIVGWQKMAEEMRNGNKSRKITQNHNGRAKKNKPKTFASLVRDNCLCQGDQSDKVYIIAYKPFSASSIHRWQFFRSLPIGRGPS